MKTGNQQAPEQEYPLETALETHCLLKKGNNNKDHKDYTMCKEILYKLYWGPTSFRVINPVESIL